MKKFTIQSLDNSFAFKAFTSADIIFQIFKTSFSIIRKKNNFCHKLSSFNRCTQTPHHPLKGQNLLSVTTKVFFYAPLAFYVKSP